MDVKLRRSIREKLKRWHNPRSRTRKRFEQLMAEKQPELDEMSRLFEESRRNIDWNMRVTI